jgi:hypothetical protein
VKAVEDSKWINTTLQNAKIIDTKVDLKADIFNAATVDFTQLKASIQADETIPEDKKAEILVQTASERIKHFSKVIFDEEQATMVKRNERAAWSTQIKDFVEGLRTEQREKFKKFDISYSPTVVKAKALTKTPTGPRKKKPAFDTVVCRQMADKYGVPMHSVQMLATSQNMSIEDAAKKMADLLGVTK